MARDNNLLKSLTFPWVWFRKNIYQDFYLRELERLNEYMGGRAKSGAVGSRARSVRIAINMICLAIIFTSIFLDGGLTLAAFSTFWQSGGLLQFWAEGALLACMAVNMVAVLFGTAANFSKIQQYTHLELTLEELINEKKKANGQQPSERLPMPLSKRVMLFIRYLHDFNGFAGSAVSLLLFVGCALSFMFPGFYSMPLFVCATLFCVSRASSLVSVVFAPMTNQLRLNYYKGRTADQIKEYYGQHALQKDNQQALINVILDKVFTKDIVTSIPKQHELVRFACYRALERHKLNDGDHTALINSIQKSLTDHFQDRLHHSQDPTFIPISAVEDTYMITELVDAAVQNREKISNPLIKLRLNHSYSECLLEAMISNKISDATADKVNDNMTKSPFLISHQSRPYTIKTDTVKHALPLKANQHGAEFVPGYHCEQIAKGLVPAF